MNQYISYRRLVSMQPPYSRDIHNLFVSMARSVSCTVTHLCFRFLSQLLQVNKFYMFTLYSAATVIYCYCVVVHSCNDDFVVLKIDTGPIWFTLRRLS